MYASRARTQQQEEVAAATPAAGGVPARNKAGINSVKIDGLVVLQLVKHCGEAFPETVAGALQGLDLEGVLEITHRCAPATGPTRGPVRTGGVCRRGVLPRRPRRRPQLTRPTPNRHLPALAASRWLPRLTAPTAAPTTSWA
jgi:hypothetical protein